MDTRKINFENLILFVYVFIAIVATDGSNIMQFARVVIFGVFLLKLLMRKGISWNLYMTWLILFLLFAFLSSTWANSKSFALSMTKTLMINALCMISLMYIINFKSTRYNVVLKAIAIAPIFLELRIALAGGLLAGFHGARSVANTSLNIVGLSGAFGTCCALVFIFKNVNVVIWKICFIFDLLVVLLSASRKALFCALIPLFIAFITNTKTNLIHKIRRLLIVTICIAVFYICLMKVPVLYDSVGHRIESMIAAFMGDSSEADASTVDRLRLITWGFEWFKQQPFLGHGIDNYRVVLHEFRSDYSISYYAHNNYVEMLVDVGIIGTALFYWNYVYMLFVSFKNRKLLKKEDSLILGMLIAIAINEVGLVSYFDKFIQIIILIIWINTYTLNKSEKTFCVYEGRKLR